MKLKKIIILILGAVFLALLTNMNVFAEVVTGQCGENVSWTLDTETDIVRISGSGKMDMKYDSYGNYSYEVKAIYVESGVQNISTNIFNSCYALSELHISETVTEIQNGLKWPVTLSVISVAPSNPKFYASQGCLIDKESKTLLRAFPGFIIPSDGSVLNIGSRAISLLNVTSITVPDCVKRIENYAFHGCADLKNINIPASMEYIGNGAFEDTALYNSFNQSGTGSLYISGWLLDVHSTNSGAYTINDGTVGIASGAFEYCQEITSVTIPASVRFIGSHAFADCIGITSLAIPYGVTHIYEHTFNGCKNLSAIALPDSVVYFGEGAFAYTGIKEISIPKGMTVIEKETFSDCTGLEKVSIPASVNSIEKHAFHSCTNLTDIYYAESESYWQNIYINSAITVLSSGEKNKGYDYYRSLGYGNTVLDTANIHYNCDPTVKVIINGIKLVSDQEAIIVDGRTLVPMRAIFEQLGATVGWDGTTMTASGTRGSIHVTISIGNAYLTKNGEVIPLDVPAQLINGRTLVPARAIAESFGADVDWDGETRTVIIRE